MRERGISPWTPSAGCGAVATAKSALSCFAGVSILNPSLFADTPDGAFSLNLIFDKAAAHRRLFGLRLEGFWMHVGTPSAVAEADARLADSDELRCQRTRGCDLLKPIARLYGANAWSSYELPNPWARWRDAWGLLGLEPCGGIGSAAGGIGAMEVGEVPNYTCNYRSNRYRIRYGKSILPQCGLFTRRGGFRKSASSNQVPRA